MCVELRNPKSLLVEDRWTGGSQEWYRGYWKQKSGCGPTNAALMTWYLAQTRSKYAALCEIGDQKKADFLHLMDEMFCYIKPSWQGVNTGEKFACGLEAYAKRRGIALPLHVLPVMKSNMLSCHMLAQYISESLLRDCPVAFLNLHSGKTRLDGWHWMMIISYDKQSNQAICCDNGKVLTFSLKDWMETTKRGGAFVTIER